MFHPHFANPRFMKHLIHSLLLAGAATTFAFAQSATPGLIGHRGASHAAPENTLAAMELAWKEGADGVEADFHLSKDGEVVCMHDYDTLRTTGVKKVIKDTPWAELATLDAGAWKSEASRGEKIPRFADVLTKLPAGKLFFIEVKSGPETIAPIKAILETHHGKFDPKMIYIIAFDPAVVAEARRQLPTYQTHLLTSLKDFGDAAAMKKLDESLTQTTATGLQFKFLPAVTREWVQEIKGRGLLTDSWTVNDPKQAAKLVELGVDYITTDRPGPLRAELKKLGSIP
jgi:glycerophosphoryl diester phosphodiesterase